MEVKNPLAFLEKRDSSMTKTFITNLFIGLVAFLVFSGVASIASAQEEDDSLTPAQMRQEKLEELSEQKAEKQAQMQEQRDEQKAIMDERREAMASQTDAMREKVEERREDMASRTDAVREKIEERKAVISERIKNRILALADNVTRKMKAAIGRLTQIIGRFETRIDTLEARGVDGSAAQAKLDEATGHLARASSILENEVNTHVDATVGSDDPRAAWQAGKAKFSEAREAIRSAHQAIREALALLKAAVDDVQTAVAEENDDSEENTEETNQ